jgi:DNA-directed RNA polymerase subunit K/omega
MDINKDDDKDDTHKIKLSDSTRIYDNEKYDKSMTPYYNIKNQSILRVPNDKRTTRNVLTKYEKARIISERVEQLRRGVKPKIEYKSKSLPYSSIYYQEIALMELEKKKLNFIIRRYLSNNTYEDWKLNELAIN